MAPRTKQQVNSAREASIQKILSASLALFSAQGYFRTSIEQIARKAGISKGLIYNYFSSKEDLLRTIVYKGLEKILASFDPDQNGIISDKEFSDLICFYFKEISEQRIFYKLLFSLFTQPGVNEILSSDYEKLSKPYISLLLKYFSQKGIPEPEKEIYFLLCLMDGISLNYTMNPETVDLEYLREKILRWYTLSDQKRL